MTTQQATQNLGGLIFMRNKIILIIFLLITTNVFAGDYVCFDQDGTITGKYKSVDGSNLSGCLRITREVYEALTQWKKVSGGQVVDMTQAEIDAILQAEADAQAQAETTAVNNLDVTLREAFIAWLQLYNAKVPAQYQITAQEMIQQIRDNK